MQYALFTADGRVMLFHIEAVAELYKTAFGGTVKKITDQPEQPVIIPAIYAV